jgi:hypothetical protein
MAELRTIFTLLSLLKSGNCLKEKYNGGAPYHLLEYQIRLLFNVANKYGLLKFIIWLFQQCALLKRF